MKFVKLINIFCRLVDKCKIIIKNTIIQLKFGLLKNIIIIILNK